MFQTVLRVLLFIPQLGNFIFKVVDEVSKAIKTSRYDKHRADINEWVRNDKGKPNP